MTKKILVIGDSSVNVFLQIPKVAENVSVENVSRLMQFRLGSKTQLEREVVTVGGNALNVAVGLSRQGIDVDLYSIIGEDDDGDRILEFFTRSAVVIPAKAGIQDSFKNKINLKIEKKDDVKTNVGYVIDFQSERFLLIDTSSKTYSLSSTDYRLQTTDWLFVSSIGPNYEGFFKELLELKKKIGFKLSYNPSSNELKNSVESYIEMVKASDVLFVNKKEMKKIIVSLLDCSIAKNQLPSSTISSNYSSKLSSNDELIKKLWEITRKLVVVTDGVRGSYAFDGEEVYFEPSSGEEAVEKTGAGDAFESGFLAEYLKTGDIQMAMRNGTENAGSVIKYIGAVEGLLYK